VPARHRDVNVPTDIGGAEKVFETVVGNDPSTLSIDDDRMIRAEPAAGVVDPDDRFTVVCDQNARRHVDEAVRHTRRSSKLSLIATSVPSGRSRSFWGTLKM
jgi:hypothetical protein